MIYPTLFPLVLLSLLLAAPGLTRAEESVLQERPGHSVHGDSFAEGPRRFAVLMGGTGDVHFPVSTQSAEAQRFFDQGVGQLHGFWYYEAERSFRQVLFLDPSCLMAYWGMAMANVENEPRAREIIAQGIKDVSKATEIEQLWLRSVEKYFAVTKNDDERKNQAKQVVRDWEEISRREPTNLEAKAFVVYQTWWNSSKRNLPLSSPLSTQALADQILSLQPQHPTHHFLIHLWDAEGARLGTLNAAQCGPSAPNIAHMWHMPGHIYTDLHRWGDAAWQQEASVRVDHRHMLERRTMPDQIHNYAHNSEWMIRNWNHGGRLQDSLTVARNMMEEPRIPRSHKVAETPDQTWDAGGTAYALGRQRLIETLLLWEGWDQALALAQTPYLDAGLDTLEQIQRDHLVALAHYGKGSLVEAQTAQARVAEGVAKLRQERADALTAAETKVRLKEDKADAINKSLTEALPAFTPKITTALNLLAELNLAQAVAEGRKETAQELRKKISALPEARAIRWDLQLGNLEAAEKAARAQNDKNPQQVHASAQLVEVLRAARKTEDAEQAWTKLRTVAASGDENLPILQRLAPGPDWRTPAPAPADLGPHPALDTLGPLLWSPPPAPTWQVTDSAGHAVRSADFVGQPYVLLCFLGKGCPHCVQQLRAFAPHAAAFTQSGLTLLAFSTDTPLGVAETVQLGADGPSPVTFPLYSDVSLSAFRAFDAYDDFESKPLHGTFLVDATGHIRWQHISYEPFMRPDFLLTEAQRLLKLCVNKA